MANIRWLKANFFLTSLKGAFFFVIFLFIFPSSCCFAQQIVINEIYTPTSSDWVELYNLQDQEAFLDGWILKDSTSQIGSTIEATISGRGFLTIEVSNRLNKDGDTVYLQNKLGEEKDSFVYDKEVESSICFGKNPDGGAWHQLTPCTKNTTNNASNIIDPSPSPSSSPSPSPSSLPSPSRSPSPSPSSKISSSPSPSSKSQALASTVSSKKVSPSPSSSPSVETLISPSPSATVSPSPQVLGEESGFNKKLLIPLGFMGAGSLLLGVAFGPALLKQAKERWYTRKI